MQGEFSSIPRTLLSKPELSRTNEDVCVRACVRIFARSRRFRSSEMSAAQEFAFSFSLHSATDADASRMPRRRRTVGCSKNVGLAKKNLFCGKRIFLRSLPQAADAVSLVLVLVLARDVKSQRALVAAQT